MNKDPFPEHGPQRRRCAPWRRVCRCGLDAYLCIVVRTVYRNRLNAAHAWQDLERCELPPVTRPRTQSFVSGAALDHVPDAAVMTVV